MRNFNIIFAYCFSEFLVVLTFCVVYGLAFSGDFIIIFILLLYFLYYVYYVYDVYNKQKNKKNMLHFILFSVILFLY